MKKFEMLIEKSINCINERKFNDAENYLKEAMILNLTNPQTHNLFGILEEQKGDILIAAKHYRAASALDPSYKPAINNLQRITGFNKDANKQMINYDLPEEEKFEYLIEYDELNIGHIKKNRKVK